MIKRFSQATARHLNGDPYPYMELNQNGSYVLYKDHAAILESIGAGGVSGRITSKSIDEHRAEFEAHWRNIQSRGLDNGWLGVAWAAWKAARGIKE